eukprot:scaffold42506_cov48-Phaeocystis_antarctica.AAC.1
MQGSKRPRGAPWKEAHHWSVPSQKLHLGWQDAGGPSEVSSARCVTAPSQRTPFAGLRGTHAAHALSSMHPPCPGALLRRAAAPLSFKATPVAFADARDTSGF